MNRKFDIGRLRIFIERLINLVTVKVTENNKTLVYFSKPLVLPPTEDSVEEKYRESVIIVNRWIDEVLEEIKDSNVDEETIRSKLREKMRKNMM